MNQDELLFDYLKKNITIDIDSCDEGEVIIKLSLINPTSGKTEVIAQSRCFLRQ